MRDNNYLVNIICLILGVAWGFGFNYLTNNKEIVKCQEIDKQLKIEYEDLSSNK